MSKVISDMLRVKVGGKYVKSAKEVAEYHGVHVNAVYQNRRGKRNPDRLDKLMLFDEASKVDSCECDIELTVRGSKEVILDSMSKVMVEGKQYLVVFAEQGG